MKACKIICVLLVSIYYSSGHCMFRNYNNEQPSEFPTLNFHTFPEYFKPSFWIQNRAGGNLAPRMQLVNNWPNLPPRAARLNTQTRSSTPSGHGAVFRPTARSSSFTVNPISSSHSYEGTLRTKPTKSFTENSTPHVTNTKKQTTQLNRQRNGMLSMIRNMLKPLMSKMEKSGRIAKTPTKSHDTINDNHPHGIHFKVIPKLVKKEVAKQLKTILGKRPIDKFNDNIKKEQNKTEKTKKKIIEGLDKKNNATEQLNVNKTSSDEYKQEREYKNKIGAKSIFGNFVGNKHFTNIFVFFPNNDDSPLVVGIKDNMTDLFNLNTTDNSTENQSDNDKLNNEKLEDEKEEDTENVENGLVGNKDDVSTNDNAANANKDNEAQPTEVIVSTETMIPTSNAETSTTDIIPINDNVTSEDNDNIVDSENDLAGNKEDDNIEVESDNGLTEEEEQVTTPDNNSKTTEDSISTTTEILTTTELVNDDEVTVPNAQTENPSENLTENLNNGKDESDNEDNSDDKVYEEYDDIIKEKDDESTVVPVTNSTTDATEDSNVSTTEVLVSTDTNVETTANTESESEATSENSTESTTTDLVETLSTSDEESTTQNAVSNTEEDLKNSTTDSNNTNEDDYLDIEYAYF